MQTTWFPMNNARMSYSNNASSTCPPRTFLFQFPLQRSVDTLTGNTCKEKVSAIAEALEP